MGDVARRVGVSRVTIYKLLPGQGPLIEAVLLHELRRFLRDIDEAVAPATTRSRSRLVEGFVFGLTYLRRPPPAEPPAAHGARAPPPAPDGQGRADPGRGQGLHRRLRPPRGRGRRPAAERRRDRGRQRAARPRGAVLRPHPGLGARPAHPGRHPPLRGALPRPHAAVLATLPEKPPAMSARSRGRDHRRAA